MDRRRLRRLARGTLCNVPFANALNLAYGFGLPVARIGGSHRLLTRAGVHGLLNLQDVPGEAIPGSSESEGHCCAAPSRGAWAVPSPPLDSISRTKVMNRRL